VSPRRPERRITVRCMAGFRDHHWLYRPRFPIPTDADWRCVRCLRWYDDCTRRAAA
jgi:hypothetical protein